MHSLGINTIAAMISAMFIAGAGYVINDYYDIKIDRINRPQRVLPSGRMQPQVAFIYSVILFLTGFFISFLTNSIYCIIIAFFNCLILYFYTKFWKKSFLIGNLLVAYAAASTFLYGGLATNNFTNSLIIALFAFFYTLLREITKDTQDVKGDKAEGAGTLALRLGEIKTWWISLIPALIILLLPFILFYKNYYNIRTSVLMLILVSLPIIVLMGFIRYGNHQRKYEISSRWMKIDMIILLIINGIG